MPPRAAPANPPNPPSDPPASSASRARGNVSFEDNPSEETSSPFTPMPTSTDSTTPNIISARICETATTRSTPVAGGVFIESAEPTSSSMPNRIDYFYTKVPVVDDKGKNWAIFKERFQNANSAAGVAHLYLRNFVPPIHPDDPEATMYPSQLQVYNTWTRLENLARIQLTNCLSDAMLRKELQVKTEVAILNMKTSWENRLCGDKDNVREFLDEDVALVEEIEDAGGQVSDSELRSHLLKVIPDLYRNFINTLIESSAIQGIIIHQEIPHLRIRENYPGFRLVNSIQRQYDFRQDKRQTKAVSNAKPKDQKPTSSSTSHSNNVALLADSSLSQPPNNPPRSTQSNSNTRGSGWRTAWHRSQPNGGNSNTSNLNSGNTSVATGSNAIPLKSHVADELDFEEGEIEHAYVAWVEYESESSEGMESEDEGDIFDGLAEVSDILGVETKIVVGTLSSEEEIEGRMKAVCEYMTHNYSPEVENVELGEEDDDAELEFNRLELDGRKIIEENEILEENHLKALWVCCAGQTAIVACLHLEKKGYNVWEEELEALPLAQCFWPAKHWAKGIAKE
ncbi:hypothetical protein K435DRAFT_867999 [Dendrothele bispora CBS 962.96]|uniref:Uncharacterized protein n=1 Tax=Dendrothele bispora (strain CBS 962.96) TaxID=1314807 RepID=A0A4S8LCW5_DENBC|nr:hypothetical protein K435DRAFT_867999 [Dendrothele bispora CBS 962.96]